MNKKIISKNILTIVVFLLIGTNLVILTTDAEAKKEKSNKESGEILKNYLSDNPVFSTIIEDESILEIVRIPKDKPLTVANAEYIYCWYLSQEGDQISVIKNLDLWQRIQTEFDDEQVSKFKELDCPKILQ